MGVGEGVDVGRSVSFGGDVGNGVEVVPGAGAASTVETKDSIKVLLAGVGRGGVTFGLIKGNDPSKT